MKHTRILAGALLAGLWAGSAFGQAPAAPAAPAGAEAAAAKPTFCERLDKAIDKCRRKCCASPFGQFINAITKPLTAATGGIIPSFCPGKPSEEDLKKPGAEGAAAQALKDAVEAAARRKAVRLLGTFDCHWHPEAEAGLAAALRTDRAECVRLEAAIALHRGCCCTRLIVEALEDCVAGTEKFGPSENSPRVQAIAAKALERCCGCPDAAIIEEEPAKDEVDPKNLDKEGSNLQKGDPMTPLKPAGPMTKGSGKATRAQLAHARRTLAMAQPKLARVDLGQGAPVAAGRRSLAGLANYVAKGSSANSVAMETVAPPMATPAETYVTSNTPMLKSAPPAVMTQPIVKTAPPKAIDTPVVKTPPMIVTKPLNSPVVTQPSVPVVREPVKAVSPPPALKIESPENTAPVIVVSKTGSLDPQVTRSLEILRDAEDPEVRHSAVRSLVACNWRNQPEILSGLVYSARFDKHAGMRVACIRSLAAMKAATPEVMAALKPLTNDADEWIRQETTQALTYLENASSQSATLKAPASR